MQFSIGNPGVPLLIEAWGPPPGLNLPSDLTAAYRQEFDSQLQQASGYKINGIEYYLGWGVAEPERDKWDWSLYKDAAQKIKASGFQFIPVIWMQNLPHWVRNNPSFPRSSNVVTGLETDSLSIFAKETHDAYDTFYGHLKTELGPYIDVIRLNSPYDYGEIAYPGGAATRVFPLKNVGPGFWVNESEARADFRKTMAAKYGTIDDLNQAWNTHFASFQAIDYPKDPSHKRYWLDFIDWYYSALTNETGQLIDIVQSHFPTTPISFNIGWPFEKITLGDDISGLAKMAAQKKVYVRTPTGPSVSFLYTKHVATSVHFYKPLGFSSEPVDSNASQNAIAMALFKDLTTGVGWHFEYLPNIQRATPEFDSYMKLWHPRRYPDVDMALFFPTSAHRLDDWNSWNGTDQFAGGFPDGMKQFGEELREVVDYDVVDERLIQDNALSSYQSLVWPFGDVAEADTLAKMYQWVQNGGVLVVKDLSQIKTPEGGSGAFGSAISQGTRIGSMISVGKGFIFDGQGSLDNILPLIVYRANLQKLNPQYPERMTSIAPLDVTLDGVLVSEFADGVLLFNRTDTNVVKNLTFPPGQWKESYVNLPSSVELRPSTLTWIDGATGAVR